MAWSPWGLSFMVVPTMLADLVRAPDEQPHLVHGVEQLAVGGLEPVDLGDGAGDDNAHRVGHVVLFQRLGDRLVASCTPAFAITAF